MSRSFLVTQKIDLSDLGEGWEGCYLSFRALTLKDLDGISKLDPEGDAESAVEAMVSLLQKHFISGEAYMSGKDGEGKLTVKPEDLSELPVTIISRCIKELAGSTDPKS